MSDDADAELQKFREEWKQEVTARSKNPLGRGHTQSTPLSGLPAVRSVTGLVPRAKKLPIPNNVNEDAKNEAGAPESGTLHKDPGLINQDETHQLRAVAEVEQSDHAISERASSALEHYEKAVEREEQGSLGDSVSLYRKAYRLDAGVDKIYRKKHFPPAVNKTKPADPNPSNASVTVPNTAHHSLDGPPVSGLDLPQLIASFAALSIPPIVQPTDQSPQPPCPISSLPFELLIDILKATAILDVATFARCALVCKRLAYLVYTEDRIWQQVCLHPEYGFEAMHYDWGYSLSGGPIHHIIEPLESQYEMPPSSDDLSSLFAGLDIGDPFPSWTSMPLSRLDDKYPTYRSMFRSRPRIRFNGCYISTVNYIRPGAATTTQVSWNTPVHIVTYYRYLRFFRDGSCVSLLTTAEPVDVVHHLTKANIPTTAQYAKTNPSLIPPMSIMQHALRGRWKLQSPTSASEEEPESTLSIETLGIDPDKYTYVLSLALQSTRRREGTRNNKLAWRGFWSYNKLTDDWAEFGLKNDKPFIWSRVGSYGMGE